MSDEEEDESPEVTMVRLRNAERCVDQLHAAMMKNIGMMHGSRLQQYFNATKLRHPEATAWEWQTMPPCPLQSALAKFDVEDGVQAARRILALQALHFDAVTENPLFAHVQACRLQGLQVANEQLQAENLSISEGEAAEQIERTFDTAFMQGLGQGLSMTHGNWHDLGCAIAYRHSLLNIVDLIGRGKISSARRALKAARSCELCRKPKEPMWDFAALAAKMDQVAAQAPQGGGSGDGGPSVSSHDAGSSSDAVSAAPVVTTTAPLHPLLQVICTVLEYVARHSTTHSLAMLRRSCRDTNIWRAEAPLYVAEPGEDAQRLGLAFRLAKALEQQQGLEWPSERVFEFSTSLSMYDDAIDELQVKLVGRRRERLMKRFRDYPERGDAMRSLVPTILFPPSAQGLPVGVAVIEGHCEAVH
jgi:hypothetical protein